MWNAYWREFPSLHWLFNDTRAPEVTRNSTSDGRGNECFIQPGISRFLNHLAPELQEFFFSFHLAHFPRVNCPRAREVSTHTFHFYLLFSRRNFWREIFFFATFGLLSTSSDWWSIILYKSHAIRKKFIYTRECFSIVCLANYFNKSLVESFGSEENLPQTKNPIAFEQTANAKVRLSGPRMHPWVTASKSSTGTAKRKYLFGESANREVRDDRTARVFLRFTNYKGKQRNLESRCNKTGHRSGDSAKQQTLF